MFHVHATSRKLVAHKKVNHKLCAYIAWGKNQPYQLMLQKRIVSFVHRFSFNSNRQCAPAWTFNCRIKNYIWWPQTAWLKLMIAIKEEKYCDSTDHHRGNWVILLNLIMQWNCEQANKIEDVFLEGYFSKFELSVIVLSVVYMQCCYVCLLLINMTRWRQ